MCGHPWKPDEMETRGAGFIPPMSYRWNSSSSCSIYHSYRNVNRVQTNRVLRVYKIDVPTKSFSDPLSFYINRSSYKNPLANNGPSLEVLSLSMLKQMSARYYVFGQLSSAIQYRDGMPRLNAQQQQQQQQHLLLPQQLLLPPSPLLLILLVMCRRFALEIHQQ